MDEDYSLFDPRKYWSTINNELICSTGMKFEDETKIEKLIKYLDKPRTMVEMIRDLEWKQGEINKLFSLLRFIRNLSLERTDIKGALSYRIIDRRITS